MNGFGGGVLRVLKGLTYNANSESKCYNATEDFIISFDTGSDVFRKIYIPAYWAEAQIFFQDFFAITSGVFVDCNVDKAFNTITHLISTEGVSELGGRLAGSAMFELSDCIGAWNDDSMSKEDKGYKYGKCLSVILNYTI